MIHSRATQKATNLSLTVVTLFVITNLPYVVDEFIRYLIGWVFLNTSQGGRGEDFFSSCCYRQKILGGDGGSWSDTILCRTAQVTLLFPVSCPCKNTISRTAQVAKSIVLCLKLQ